MINKTISVPEINCDHCKHTIEGALSKLEGVSRVQVRVPDKNVEVEFEESSVQLEAIVNAIEEQGYEVGEL